MLLEHAKEEFLLRNIPSKALLTIMLTPTIVGCQAGSVTFDRHDSDKGNSDYAGPVSSAPTTTRALTANTDTLLKSGYSAYAQPTAYGLNLLYMPPNVSLPVRHFLARGDNVFAKANLNKLEFTDSESCALDYTYLATATGDCTGDQCLSLQEESTLSGPCELRVDDHEATSVMVKGTTATLEGQFGTDVLELVVPGSANDWQPIDKTTPPPPLTNKAWYKADNVLYVWGAATNETPKLYALNLETNDWIDVPAVGNAAIVQSQNIATWSNKTLYVVNADRSIATLTNGETEYKAQTIVEKTGVTRTGAVPFHVEVADNKLLLLSLIKHSESARKLVVDLIDLANFKAEPLDTESIPAFTSYRQIQVEDGVLTFLIEHSSQTHLVHVAANSAKALPLIGGSALPFVSRLEGGRIGQMVRVSDRRATFPSTTFAILNRDKNIWEEQIPVNIAPRSHPTVWQDEKWRVTWGGSGLASDFLNNDGYLLVKASKQRLYLPTRHYSPSPRSAPIVTVFGNRLYVWGGCAQSDNITCDKPLNDGAFLELTTK